MFPVAKELGRRGRGRGGGSTASDSFLHGLLGEPIFGRGRPATHIARGLCPSESSRKLFLRLTSSRYLLVPVCTCIFDNRTDIRRIEREPESGDFPEPQREFLLRAARQHDEVALPRRSPPQCQFERARRCADGRGRGSRMRAASAPMTGGVVPIARRGLVASARAASSRGAMFLAPLSRVGTNPADLRFARRASGASGSPPPRAPARRSRPPDSRPATTDWRASRRARAASTSAASRGPEEAVAPPPPPSRVNNLGRALRPRLLARAGGRTRREAVRTSHGSSSRPRRPPRRGPHPPRRLHKRRQTRRSQDPLRLRARRQSRASSQGAPHPRRRVLRGARLRRRHARHARRTEPDGRRRRVPRAGCPLLKVQETLDRLTSKGFGASCAKRFQS